MPGIARRVGSPPLERHEVRLCGLRLGISARCGIAAFTAFLLGAAPAAAQFRVDLEPGADVRLSTAVSALQVRGKVVRMDGNGTTVVIWPRGALPGTETGYALRDLASLEARGGRDRARGALVGAGIATVLAAVFGGIDRARGAISSGELAGTVAGNAVVGGVLGFAFAPRGWRALPLPGRP